MLPSRRGGVCFQAHEGPAADVTQRHGCAAAAPQRYVAGGAAAHPSSARTVAATVSRLQQRLIAHFERGFVH